MSTVTTSYLVDPIAVAIERGSQAARLPMARRWHAYAAFKSYLFNLNPNMPHHVYTDAVAAFVRRAKL